MRVLSSLLYLLNRNRSSWNQLALKLFLFFYFAEVLPVFPHMMFAWSATLQLDLICYLPLLNYCAKMKKLFPGNVLYLLEILHLLLALVVLICRVIGSCLRGIYFFIFSIMWNRTCCRKSPPPSGISRFELKVSALYSRCCTTVKCLCWKPCWRLGQYYIRGKIEC